MLTAALLTNGKQHFGLVVRSPVPCRSMSGFRIRTPIFAMLFAFAFTGYVQRSSVAIAAERMMPELGGARLVS